MRADEVYAGRSSESAVREHDRGAWRSRAAIVVPVFAAVILISLRFAAPVMPMDEGIPLVYGDLVRRGFVPHRDFQSFYGPGMPWLVAVADALLGPSLWTERVVATLCQLVAVAAIATFARRWGDAVAIVAGLVSVVAFEAPRAIFAWAALAALACALCSVVIATRAANRRAGAVAGLIGGVTLLFRPDYVLVTCVPALFPFSRWDRTIRIAYAAGLAVGALPLAAHAAVAGPSTLVANLIVDAPIAVQQRGQPLFDGRLDAIVVTIVLLTAIGQLWRALRIRRERGGDVELAAYAALTLLLYPQAITAFDPIHISIVTGTGLPLLVIVFAQLGVHRRVGARVARVAVPAAVIFCATALVELGSPEGSLAVTRGDRSYLENVVEAPTLNAIIAASQSYARPGARLFVGPADLSHTSYNDTILYFLYPDLVPASYYLEMNPGTADRPGSRLADDIASADMLILTTRWDHFYEVAPSSVRGSDEATRVVAERFRLVDTEGQYSLYVHR